ncbi:mechanosensitive ion channel [Erythrobacter citreus]|uniref:Small-conductance mechanosensitive channel n=1 Tax=Qipengyuania citrea TaxID=225971 RepID=A0A6I4U850_9SPHN|nr:mechanosensitive ion channel family protein [Qipengyuania citrea]MDQ0566728.1 small-conductance mechanosensitive channel [Qipengyuania citrea]MXP35082.1 mechanosensitive ion channel [Qipengyuania citrea]
MIRLLALAALLWAVPLAAQLEVPAEPTETPTPVQTIAATQEAGDDRRIAERIAGIFAELPAFGAVEVEVNEGVVSLSGTVPKPDDIARAEAIVNRVAGVVTVENGLERDLSLSAGSAGILTLADRWNSLVRMLPLIGMALGVWLAIAFLGYLIAGLGRLWHRIAPNSFLAELIASAIRFGFTIVGLVIALDMIGATALLGAVLGGAGVIGIALGFAMRDTIENYVASLLLSLRQPFRANDWVQIDTYEGRVIRLTSRATVLMTLDGNHLRIPNGQVFKAVIVNFTRNPQRRFHFDLGVDADDDARAARQLGRDTLAGLAFVLSDPPPEARIIEVGDSNVVIRFLGWVDQRDTDWWKAQSQAIPAVKGALEDAGFGLPEPIYRLRFDPRSATVPFAAEAATATVTPSADEPPQAKRAVRDVAASPADEDVRPADEIAAMVEEERNRPGEEQNKDLLDHSRPVE